MLRKILYRGRFQKLCGIYGARIALWPDHEQANARAYMQRCPQKAEADLKSALHIDAIINRLAPPSVSEESQWQALGQLAPNIGLLPVTAEIFSAYKAEVIAEPVAEIVEVHTADEKNLFGGNGAMTVPSEAAYEIREERARMIAKGKKRVAKGILKFQ